MTRQQRFFHRIARMDADYQRHFAEGPASLDIAAALAELIAAHRRHTAVLDGCAAQLERDGDAIAVLEGERDGLRARVASLEAENNLLRRKLVAWRVCAAIGVVIATWWAWEVAR